MGKNLILERKPDGSYSVVQEAEAVAGQTKPMDLEQVKALEGIVSWEVGKVPLGAGLIGGAIALTTASLTARLLPNVTGPLANLGGAWLLMNWGERFLGPGAAKYAAIFLAYEAFKGTVEDMVGRMVGSVSAMIPTTKAEPAAEEETAANANAGGYEQAGLFGDKDLERWIEAA